MLAMFGALLVGFVATDVGGWSQFLIQIKGVVIAIALSAVGTGVLVWLIDRTIGLRATEEEQQAGLDHSQHGEDGYGLTHL